MLASLIQLVRAVNVDNQRVTFYKPNIKSPLNRDEVRILVNDLGYIEAAKRLNIKVPTLRQWAHRGKWNVQTRTDQRVTLVTPARKPADVHSEALHELKRDTKMSLAKSAARLAKDAEGARLRDSGHIKEVAQTWAIVHEVGNDKGNTQILNVAVLTGAEVPEKIVNSQESE